MNDMLTILCGDVESKLRELPDESVQCVVTSPPYYGLRDYDVAGQIGLEDSPQDYVQKLVDVFREVRRVLKKDGTLWLNIGDSYASNHVTGTKDEDTGWKHGKLSQGYQARAGGGGNGLKPKDLMMIPARVALALQADGWWLRQDIIWAKPNPMPESVTDRCTKSHEYIFMFAKSPRYFFEKLVEPPKEVSIARLKRAKSNHNKYCNGNTQFQHQSLHKPRKRLEGIAPSNFQGSDHLVAAFDEFLGCNKRSVWVMPTACYDEAHFATFPEELPKLCILAGTKAGDVVLDPFGGSGTTGKVALELGRKAILIELNPQYIPLIEKRCNTTLGLPLEVKL